MKQILFATLLLASITMVAQSSSNEPKELRYDLNDNLIEQEMTALSQQMVIPLCYNTQVKCFISMYVNYRNEQTNSMLQRANTLLPVIEQVLERHQLPNELKYFAMVESAMNHTASSHNGQTGLWQLSSVMAKQYNLTVDRYNDERVDPELSTEAACTCLENLYAHYGDWLLTLTAYNMGVAYVDKAIATADGRDYWTLQQHLPIEVRGYIPAYMAVVYIMSRPEEFGLYPVCPVDIWNNTETVLVDEILSFEDIQSQLDITMETLSTFNPKYVKMVIPASPQSPQSIRLPKEIVNQFKQTFKTI